MVVIVLGRRVLLVISNYFPGCIYWRGRVEQPKEYIPSHYSTLAKKFGIKFRTVQGEIDVEINTVRVQGSLCSVYSLEVFLEEFS
jgi:hypothetical protein